MRYPGLGRRVADVGRMGMRGSMSKRRQAGQVEAEADMAIAESALANQRRVERDLSLMEKMRDQDVLLEQQEIDMRAEKEDAVQSMMDPAVQDESERLRRRKQRNAGAYKRFINRMLLMRKASLAGEDLGDIEDPLEGLDDAMEARQSNRGGY